MHMQPISKPRVVRFLTVGAVNTAFSYGVYVLLLSAGLNYAIASFAALSAGILFSFKTQGVFVFDNADNRLLGRFVFCWLLIYGANVFFIERMLMLGLDAYLSGALAMPAIATLSYVVQRFFVFRKVQGPDWPGSTVDHW